MKNIFLLLLVAFCFSYCGKGKNTTAKIEEVTDSLSTEEYAEEVVDRFVILVPEDIAEQEIIRAYPEWTDVNENDSIAIPVWGENNEPVLLGDKLKLGERWLCTTFFDVSRSWIALRTDTLTTIENKTIEGMYEIGVTTLSLTDEVMGKNVIDDEDSGGSMEVDYSLAFRGDYMPSDLIRYEELMPLTEQDSLGISNNIQEAISSGAVKSPYAYQQPDFMTLQMMCRIKDDLYLASYQPNHDESLGSRCYVLMKDNKLLLWEAGEDGIQMEVFKLKGQDYVWIRKELNYGSLWDVYKLSGDKLQNVYQMMITD